MNQEIKDKLKLLETLSGIPINKLYCGFCEYNLKCLNKTLNNYREWGRYICGKIKLRGEKDERI